MKEIIEKVKKIIGMYEDGLITDNETVDKIIWEVFEYIKKAK
jgi:hypothetical protein